MWLRTSPFYVNTTVRRFVHAWVHPPFLTCLIDCFNYLAQRASKRESKLRAEQMDHLFETFVDERLRGQKAYKIIYKVAKIIVHNSNELTLRINWKRPVLIKSHNTSVVSRLSQIDTSTITSISVAKCKRSFVRAVLLRHEWRFKLFSGKHLTIVKNLEGTFKSSCFQEVVSSAVN